jgi:hypothetical protein
LGLTNTNLKKTYPFFKKSRKGFLQYPKKKQAVKNSLL